MREYSALKSMPIAKAARVAQPPLPGRVTLDDPATAVMTDLTRVEAATTFPDESADRAHALMLERGVRLLFALDRDGTIVGLITATDLLGDKRMRVMQSLGVPHGDVRVRDLMTPAPQLEVLAYAEVTQMLVGHIVSTLRAVGRQHMLVAEQDGRLVRGIISVSQVARQLGLQLQPVEIARTFADIEAALVR